MDRWSGILKVPLHPKSRKFYRVAASLCLSPTSKTLNVPCANAIFFNGDRVEGTGNPVIERLSNLQNIAEILVSKFGESTNAWVVEASDFNGAFAIYQDFIPSLNRWGEPKSYSPDGFPASLSTVSLLESCYNEVKKIIPWVKPVSKGTTISTLGCCTPKTIILGFSKGGTVVNQLVTELGSKDLIAADEDIPHSKQEPGVECSTLEEDQFISTTEQSFLKSITEIHYVDVGLNSHGAYLTDPEVIKRISSSLVQESRGIRFVLHGTPRQWCDSRRVWIRDEKEKMMSFLASEALRSGGNLQFCERFYFSGKPGDMQMHFEIIEKLDVS
ncbi:uncharacterized protein LOC120086870 [Benincasa hispida]|uniref:uncharacterized protein LOC120086870 n=1 Tax=Benincasa hispida TaxID=102211 RepID=UPI0018FFA594|nr:uncharacterized protein LOC120086870 [Benincasa hispida]